MGIANNSTQFQDGYSNTAATIQFGAYNDFEISRSPITTTPT